jgi:spermidine synthase
MLAEDHDNQFVNCSRAVVNSDASVTQAGFAAAAVLKRMRMSDRRKSFLCFIAALLVLGASGIVAQTILLRELLTLFSGNEFSLGIIFGAWVASEAAGSFAAARRSPRRDGVEFFVYGSLLFSLAFPASIYVARIFKTLSGIPHEVGVGLGGTLGASFLVLLPTGFLHGFLFIQACSLYERITGTGASASGRVYYWETAGTILGGLAVSYLLIPHFDSFHSAVLLASINGCACLALFRVVNVSGFVPKATAVFFSIAMPILFFSNAPERLQGASLAEAWKGKNIVSYRNSFYQNIAVVRNEGQYTFFTDGTPVITTPVPDIGYVEELVHFPLLAHPHPVSVLVIGGGAGGVIAEILKHPSVRRIDYLETDPAIMKAIRDFPTRLTTSELENPLVHLYFGDPRLFLRQSGGRYDAVLLNSPLPQTLQANRLFTRESYLSVRRVMRKGGIFVLPVAGSLTYYNRELKRVNASCFATLAGVFPHRLVVPGDINLVLSSDSADVVAATPALLAERLAARRIGVNLITPEHLADRFDTQRGEWLRNVLSDTNSGVNTDFSPKGLYYGMAYRNLLFSPWMKNIFDAAGKATLPVALTAASGLLAVLFLAVRIFPASAVPLAISGTGFSAMILELLLCFAFQVVYGHFYYVVGILTGTFMGGIAAGSLAVTRFLPRFRDERRWFLLNEGTLIFFSLLVALTFALLSAAERMPVHVYPLFLLLLAVAGFVTGSQFPLAVRLQTGITPSFSVERNTGLIYGADLVGGFLGGLLGGTILIPVLGFFNCCILVAALKTGTMVLAALAPKFIRGAGSRSVG